MKTLRHMLVPFAALVLASVADAQTRVSLPTPSSFRQPSIREVQQRPTTPTPTFFFPATGIVGTPSVICHDRVFHSGSGLTVDGRYSDDNFSIAFHLGADPFLHRDRVCYPTYPICPRYPYGYYWPTYYGYRSYAVIDGGYGYLPASQPAAPPPAQPPAEQKPEPATDVERGERALQSGEESDAVRSLTAHLDDHPDDVEAMRKLAVALSLDSRVEAAAALMAMAYKTDPELCSRPIEAEAVSPDDLRKAVKRVSIFANRVETDSAWFTLAVLMQAEGRAKPAARAAERARLAGFDADIVERLDRALAQ